MPGQYVLQYRAYMMVASGLWLLIQKDVVITTVIVNAKSHSEGDGTNLT